MTQASPSSSRSWLPGWRAQPWISRWVAARAGHPSTTSARISSARGPERRTMPTPPPTPVAIAAIVSPTPTLVGVTGRARRRFPRRDDHQVAIDALALGARRQAGHVGERDVGDP